MCKRALLLLDCGLERGLFSSERALLMLELAELCLVLTAFTRGCLHATFASGDLFFEGLALSLEVLQSHRKPLEFLFQCSRFVVECLLLPREIMKPDCYSLCLSVRKLMLVLELPHPFGLRLGGLCRAGNCVLSILDRCLGGLLSGDCLGQLGLGGGKCLFAIHKTGSLLAECLLHFVPAPGVELFKALMEGKACCSGLFCRLRCLGKCRQVRFKLAQEVIEPGCVRFSVCQVT